MNEIGKTIIIIGIAITAIGGVIYLWGDKFSWFGNLPGDVKIEKENVKVYFPVVSMIVISVILSLISWLYRKFF